MKLHSILNELKIDITDQFKNEKVNVYEINIYNEFESDIIQVLLENKDGSPIHFDDLIKYNELVSNLLDSKYDSIEEEYMLEVSSAGAEREIKSEDVLKELVGKYFFVQTKIPFENDLNEFSAELKEINNDKYLFTFFIKGRPKKVELKYSDIEFIRFSVKL
ncbi:ribosome maturation factor RimP [Spiroplasma sp. TIUS-1]|uniref:hypothetical protein n=1 Tax=Spiroplasma sp. TIUS-1 TaxID=216963 RepID=UPI00139783D2|nr:hypothetical protein [Spiroplasma sp. TIUS-1]QHX35979.1 ribosome maturation factor RimP [Spiroplasma sp. TIUS-1]